MLPPERLDQIQQRFAYLEARLNAGPAAAEIAALSRDHAELAPIVARIDDWRAAQAARAGADATRPLVARKGRASYLGERSVGHLDPGAVSSALMFEALTEALQEGRA